MLGEWAGPEKLTVLVPDKLPVALPHVSWAVRVRLNAVPAGCGLEALAPI